MPQPAVMLLAALYLGSAPAPLPGPPGSKGDMKKMQGT